MSLTPALDDITSPVAGLAESYPDYERILSDIAVQSLADDDLAAALRLIPKQPPHFAAGILAADQISKWWILEVLRLPERFQVRLVDLGAVGFDLTMVWNRGVTFGLLATNDPAGRWLLILLTGAVTAGLLVWLVRVQGRIQAAALGLIIGGALGNLVDRLRHGAVTDFLDFHVQGYHWPAFNLADGGIVLGVALLLMVDLRAPAAHKPSRELKRSAQGHSRDTASLRRGRADR